MTEPFSSFESESRLLRTSGECDGTRNSQEGNESTQIGQVDCAGTCDIGFIPTGKYGAGIVHISDQTRKITQIDRTDSIDIPSRSRTTTRSTMNNEEVVAGIPDEVVGHSNTIFVQTGIGRLEGDQSSTA